jgi:hypothetical protein
MKARLTSSLGQSLETPKKTRQAKAWWLVAFLMMAAPASLQAQTPAFLNWPSVITNYYTNVQVAYTNGPSVPGNPEMVFTPPAPSDLGLAATNVAGPVTVVATSSNNGFGVVANAGQTTTNGTNFILLRWTNGTSVPTNAYTNTIEVTLSNAPNNTNATTNISIVTLPQVPLTPYLGITFTNEGFTNDPNLATVWLSFQTNASISNSIGFAGNPSTNITWSPGNVMSDPITLYSVNTNGGLAFTNGSSVIAYISYGAPLGNLSNAPSPVDTSDLSYYTPWVQFELTRGGTAAGLLLGDVGDLTFINEFSAPLSIRSYDTNGNLLQYSGFFTNSTSTIFEALAGVTQTNPVAVITNTNGQFVRVIAPNSYSDTVGPYDPFHTYITNLAANSTVAYLENNSAFPVLGNPNTNINFTFTMTNRFNSDGTMDVDGLVTASNTVSPFTPAENFTDLKILYATNTQSTITNIGGAIYGANYTSASNTIFFVNANETVNDALAGTITLLSENFNSMGTNLTLPLGFRIARTNAPVWGSASNTVSQRATATTNPSAPGGTYNLGPNTNDRSVGAITSGGFSSPNQLLAVATNTSGSTLDSVFVSYAAKRFRVNTAAASVQFFASTDGSTWTSIAFADIPASSFPTNTQSYTWTNPTTITRSNIVITNFPLANNDVIYLRWNINTTGANSQGIGIDDVSLTHSAGSRWLAMSNWMVAQYGTNPAFQTGSGAYGTVLSQMVGEVSSTIQSGLAGSTNVVSNGSVSGVLGTNLSKNWWTMTNPMPIMGDAQTNPFFYNQYGDVIFYYSSNSVYNFPYNDRYNNAKPVVFVNRYNGTNVGSWVIGIGAPVSTISPAPSSFLTYSNWLTNYPSLTGTNTNRTADPDGDGFANGKEYAFGGNPTQGSPALLTMGASSIKFIALDNASTNYGVQSTTNLTTGGWTNYPVTLTNATNQLDIPLPTYYERKEFSVPFTGTNRFFRVLFTE